MPETVGWVAWGNGQMNYVSWTQCLQHWASMEPIADGWHRETSRLLIRPKNLQRKMNMNCANSKFSEIWEGQSNSQEWGVSVWVNTSRGHQRDAVTLPSTGMEAVETKGPARTERDDASLTWLSSWAALRCVSQEVFNLNLNEFSCMKFIKWSHILIP